jgi:hypothetical protein
MPASPSEYSKILSVTLKLLQYSRLRHWAGSCCSLPALEDPRSPVQPVKPDVSYRDGRTGSCLQATGPGPYSRSPPEPIWNRDSTFVDLVRCSYIRLLHIGRSCQGLVLAAHAGGSLVLVLNTTVGLLLCFLRIEGATWSA